MPYIFMLIKSLRPARISKREDRFVWVIDSDSDFFWQRLVLEAKYSLLVEIVTPKGPMSKTPIHSSNLGGTARNPFYLIQEIRIPASRAITFVLHNTLSKGREWNQVQIALIGEKEFRASQVTGH
jgi:hypothetical protein